MVSTAFANATGGATFECSGSCSRRVGLEVSVNNGPNSGALRTARTALKRGDELIENNVYHMSTVHAICNACGTGNIYSICDTCNICTFNLIMPIAAIPHRTAMIAMVFVEPVLHILRIVTTLPVTSVTKAYTAYHAYDVCTPNNLYIKSTSNAQSTYDIYCQGYMQSL